MKWVYHACWDSFDNIPGGDPEIDGAAIVDENGEIVVEEGWNNGLEASSGFINAKYVALIVAAPQLFEAARCVYLGCLQHPEQWKSFDQRLQDDLDNLATILAEASKSND